MARNKTLKKVLSIAMKQNVYIAQPEFRQIY